MPKEERLDRFPEFRKAACGWGGPFVPVVPLPRQLQTETRDHPYGGERVPLNAPGESIEFELRMGIGSRIRGAGRGNSLPAGEGVSVRKRFP